MKKHYPAFWITTFLFTSIVSISAISFFAGPGLTSPEPIGQFLNGNFPDISPEGEPYVDAFPNLRFDSPLTFTPVPNSNVLVVGQRDGKIYWFENRNDVPAKNLLADMSNEVGVVWDGGFLGLAIHPEFGTAGKNFFYLYYTTKDGQGRDYPNGFISGFGCNQEDYWGGFLVLKRIEVNPSTFSKVANSDLVMMRKRMFSSTHRGGGIAFGNDGFLYIPTGDQSAYSKPQNTTTNLDGGVLRIDVNSDPSKSHAPIRKMPQGGRFSDEISGIGYYIPNDNPFLSPGGQRFEEYYTVGHRNPHRMTMDRLTGTFYIGEIGESTHEEVNVINKGKNYGWPLYEGYQYSGRCTTMLDNMPHEGPLVAFPRSQANAIIGGYVYRGTAMPDYYGKYICADYGTGEEIWAVDTATGSYELITQFSPTNIISFGEDNSGELYLLSQGNNVSLYKLRQNGEPEGSYPNLLSETGAFKNLQTLEPNEGVLPYDMIEPFWSDGAEKKRWMVIPNDGTHNTSSEQIVFSENGDWEFPVGSVLIKHFELPIDENNPSLTKRLETRFSVKASNGSFYFLTYKWNDQQTDAVLLPNGLRENVLVTKADGSTEFQLWDYPSTQDCISCHSPATGGTLGPRTRYLNSDYTYESTGVTANQLVTLSHLGILDEIIDDATAQGYQTHKTFDDATATLDEKARSYLDLNCAYCHRPGATGDRAQFDLRLFNNLQQTGLLTSGTNTPIGVPGEKILVPGDAAKSILYHRTDSTDPTIMMPPIAKNRVDENGVQLLEAWINQLDPDLEVPSINEARYAITNVGSDLDMDVSGGSSANRADIIQWTPTGNANQQFFIESLGGGLYSFRAMHSNKYLDVEGRGQSPGTNLIQYQGNGTIAQEFRIEYVGNDEWMIKSEANGLYLGIENNNSSQGGSVKTYPSDGTNFFKWKLTNLDRVAVTEVSVSPSEITLVEGESASITATVVPSNATDSGVVWTSSDETVATVDSQGNVFGITAGSTSITVTTNDGGFTATASITVERATVSVTGITMAPDQLNLIEGRTGQLTATVSPSDADDKTVNWISGDEAIVLVDENGLVTAVSEGSTTITVTTSDGGFTATAIITVERATVSVTGVAMAPDQLNLIEGRTGQLTATVSPSDADDKTVNWVSGDETVALVDENGLVTAVSEGSTTITVTTNDGGFTATASITVERAAVSVTGVAMAPDQLNLIEGRTGQLTATVSPSDADDKTVNWVSGDETVALVDENGFVTAVSEGSTTITVTTNDGGFTAAASITVENEVVTIPVTGIELDVSEGTVPVGFSGTITATVLPENATNQTVIWTSNDESVATVDQNGFVVALSPGTVIITATTEDGGFTATVDGVVEGNSEVILVDGVTMVPDQLNLIEGRTGQLTATVSPSDADDKTVNWVSGDETVALVDENGLVTAVSEGSTTITVTTNDGGFTATASITVERAAVSVTGVAMAPDQLNLIEGRTGQLTATVSPSDADDKTVNWVSGDETVALVDENGFVTAVSEGSTTITVTTNDGGFTAAASITVENEVVTIPVTGIELDVSEGTVPVGFSGTITATVLPENATNQTVIWTSNDESVGLVNQNGFVTAVGPGTVIITATTEDGGFTANVFGTVTSSENGSAFKISFGELGDLSEAISNLSIAPNPVIGNSNFSVSLISYVNENMVVNIWDYQGKLIKEKIVSVFYGQNTIEIDSVNLSGGTYFVTVSVKESLMVKRLIVN